MRSNKDASAKGLGAILYQTQNGQKQVIAYASRSLSRSEKNYSAFKLEYLALKWAVTEKFSGYPMNVKFTVYTDNNPLTHILTSAKLDATGQRWASALGQYNFDLIYRAGMNNTDADTMSRYPYEQLVEEEDRIKIDDKTVKTICSSTQLPIEALIEVLPAASINIIEATDCPGQPLAQIEQREIRRNQREDPVLGKWVRATIDRRFPKDYNYSKEDQTMSKTFNNLKMIRGILYREVKDGDNTIQQLVLPKVYQKTVLQGLHNDVGHPGRDRTLSLIRERFYWPRMTAEIEQWTKQCQRCLLRKSPTNNRAPLVNIVTTYPLELVCMDYLTLEPAKGVGNVLVITDHFTKYALAIATKNQTARTTAEAFYEHFITNYRIPARIHSDQGATFESEIIKELCKLTGMTKSHTTPYHPMGNPIPERFNRTLLDMLGTLEPEKKTDWKKYLPSLTYAYNCTRHETTKISPHELMFGRKPRLPIDSLFDTPVQKEASQTTKDYIVGLKKRMKETQDLVKRVSDQARTRMKSGYDKKARSARIKVGDKVLVKILKFEGKHKIEDKYEDNVYKVTGQPIQDIPVFDVQSDEGVIKRLHRNHLFLLDFIDNETETEGKGDKDDKSQTESQNEDKTEKETADEQNRTDDSVLKRKETTFDEKNETQHAKLTDEKIVYGDDDDDDDEEDYDSVNEYVIKTHSAGDAWKTVSTPTHHDVGPVLIIPDTSKGLGAKPKEKKSVKKPEESTSHTDSTELKVAESVDEAEDVDRDKDGSIDKATKEKVPEITSHTMDETLKETVEDKTNVNNDIETDDEEIVESDKEIEIVKKEKVVTEVEEDTEVDKGATVLRRSKRDRKLPKRFDSYQMNQITSRPLDRRLHSLQILLGSGILNEMDSDMTDKVLEAVMKK